MGFVDLRRRHGDEPRVGWEENGELVASARLQRVDDETVEVLELEGTAAARVVAGIAERITAARLVAHPAPGEVERFRSWGFAVSADGTECVVAIEPVAACERNRAVTLAELEAAIADGSDAATAERPDQWDPSNPARGQCGVTALVVRDLLGGEVVAAGVVLDGRRVDRHAWNRLPSGLEIDLTRRQFTHGEQLGEPQAPDAGFERRHEAAHALLAQRVRARLGLE